MDPRIREHAEIISNHSVSLEPGDTIIIDAPPAADDLVIALHELAGDIGAEPLTVRDRMGDRFRRAYLRNHDGEFGLPPHQIALFEEMDVYIAIRGTQNVTETADINQEIQTAYNRAMRPLLEERLSKRWCLTQFPTPAFAQLAEMSIEAYENFVWDAINRDWESQRIHQEGMIQLLNEGDEVRIVSGESTDIRMRTGENPTLNDYGERNLPGGEVFTAPIPDTPTGEVLFDKPVYHRGREIQDVHLRFDDGEVIGFSASKNESVIENVLDTDDGASRLGELGIGMNRRIDRFTHNMLFDEKMGDTVHLAVGNAYEDTVAEGSERNESAVHVDMIVDMSTSSVIEIDGEVVQRNGTFVFEDGFDNE